MMVKINKDKVTMASSSASTTAVSSQSISITGSATASSSVSSTTQETTIPETDNRPNVNSVEWTDYVLGLLNDDEKIKGNPTTDGLRRVFEIALNCDLVESTSETPQVPSPENEKRATVIHRLSYYLKDESVPQESKYRSVSGAADVYWGNCDKAYRNYPVAVAETRAEGRALRRALKLRKVVAAEEVVDEIEDHVDGNSVNKITSNQINFIDVLAKRLNISALKLIDSLALDSTNIYNISYDNAVVIIRKLSEFQQDASALSDNLVGYDETWKNRL
jgi:hypothetical protein